MYKYDTIRLMPSELIEIFPEAIPAIKRNLKKRKAHRRSSEPVFSWLLDKELQRIYSIDIDDERRKNLVELAKKYFYELPLSRIDNHIKRLALLLRIAQRPEKNYDGSISQSDIEGAKNFPITNFVEINKGGFTNCPFHNEKAPSLKIYPLTNSFYCFGCQAGGDVIDFVMKLYQLDFISAVKKILNK